MHPTSRGIIGQIINPAGGVAPGAVPEASTPMTIGQIVSPSGVYTGVERRQQGVLVAEEVVPPQPNRASAQGA